MKSNENGIRHCKDIALMNTILFASLFSGQQITLLHQLGRTSIMSSENSLWELGCSMTRIFEDNVIWHFSIFFDFALSKWETVINIFHKWCLKWKPSW